jgi:hypothetical protein
MEMFNLAKELPEDKIEAVQAWLLNGGEFPKWVLPPAPAPVPAPVAQQGGHAHGHGHQQQQHPRRHTLHDEFDSDEDEWRGYNYNAANFNARFGAGQVLHMDPDAARDEEVPDAPMDGAEENEIANDMIVEDTSEDEDGDDWALPQEQQAEEHIADHGGPSTSFSQPQPRDPNSTDIECGICAEVLEITQFPPSNKIMESCDHDHDMRACFGCLEQNIQSKLDEGRLHLLNCPFCPEIFGYEDVKKYATPEAFAR